MPLKIAIIGAGPAGCMLARLLLHTPSPNPPQVTIFESEPSLDFRSQGGTLDLHVKTGQAALRAGGLFEEFEKYARYDGEAIKLCDKKLLCYVNFGGAKAGGSSTGTGRPEIDRPQLRKLLYESLPNGVVKWSHKLVRVDDDRTLFFANGSKESGFDLLIGGDGAWSRVRPLVTDDVPFFSGVAGHSFTVRDAETKYPELYRIVNRGSVFSAGDKKTIMAQYMSDGSLSVATWAEVTPTWQKDCGYDVRSGPAVKAACRRDYADWDPRLLQFTQIADDDSIVPRDLFMLPIGNKWTHVPGVTLIGDAAHLMTPFAGEGVNLALEDSLKLSHAILSAADDKEALDTNVREFEQDMFVRAGKTQQVTWTAMFGLFRNPGTPRKGIERYILNIAADEAGKVGTWLLTPIVYLYFFIFKLIW